MVPLRAGVLASSIVAFLTNGCGPGDAHESTVVPDADVADVADIAANDAPSDTVPETSVEPSIPSADLAGCLIDPGPPSPVVEDPLGKNDTLDFALQGFPPSAAHPQLAAKFTFRVVAPFLIEPPEPVACALEAAAAPETVKSFVGLARGTHKYQTSIGETQHYGRYFDGKLLEGAQADVFAMFGDNATQISPGYYLPRENPRPGREGDLFAREAQRMPTMERPMSAGNVVFAVSTLFEPTPTRFGRCATTPLRALTKYMGPSQLVIDKVTLARCPAK